MHGRSQSNSSRSAQWIYRVTASRRIIPDGHSDRKHNLVDENRTYHTLKVLARSAIELANSWKVGRPESAGINRHVVGDERALQERKAANPSWPRVLQTISRGVV